MSPQIISIKEEPAQIHFQIEGVVPRDDLTALWMPIKTRLNKRVTMSCCAMGGQTYVQLMPDAAHPDYRPNTKTYEILKLAAFRLEETINLFISGKTGEEIFEIFYGENVNPWPAKLP